MWTVALSLIKRFYGPVAVIAAACLAFLLFQAGVKNVELRGKLSKARTELTETAEKLTAAELAYAQLVRDYNSAALESENRERELERQRLSAVDKVRGESNARITQLDRSLQLALNGLRHSAAADDRRSLKPAADSPAACRGYEADPTKLSLRSAEFLVGYGARADSVVLQLGECQQYIKEVVLTGQ